MKRTIEKVIGIIGAVLVTAFLGGLSLVFNALTMAQYQESIKPVLGDTLGTMSDAEVITSLKTLGSWFGFTVIGVLVFTALATLFVKRFPIRAGFCYLAAGLVTLFGSQFIGFILAFLFFVAAALCFVRKEKTNVSNQDQQSNPTGVQS